MKISFSIPFYINPHPPGMSRTHDIRKWHDMTLQNFFLWICLGQLLTVQFQYIIIYWALNMINSTNSQVLSSRICSSVGQFPVQAWKTKKPFLKKFRIFSPKNYPPKNFLYFGMKSDFTYYPNVSHLLKIFYTLLKSLASTWANFLSKE